ncbi:MAG: SDR family oxidoreductase [Candidatus Polarisedimenticolaceae bacterium]|nr:SDR family oxidoreductase [Candidatus Polarisedimenticolaceae bacterium]
MNKILLTGSTGFVGTALRNSLHANGAEFTSAIRTLASIKNRLGYFGEIHTVGEIGPDTSWDKTLEDVDTVIHLAARVHVMSDTATDPLQVFREINTTGTLKLAAAAANAGVHRFIFLSSIKVNGEFTTDQPFDEHSPTAPADPYGISKKEAEEGLRKIAAVTSMEVVIIRPPLIYGPGVKANFLRLLSIVVRGIPLPLAGIKNQRSMVALDNLVDFIILCIDHPAAANETFLISDGKGLSTAELVQCIAKQAGHSARLFSIPESVMALGAALLGKKAMLDRLTHSLQIDSSKARQLLQWQPPISTDQAIADTVTWYLQNRAR